MISSFSQKFFLVALAVVAAVSADVSHLQGGANGYNYPAGNPSFDEGPAPSAPIPQVVKQFEKSYFVNLMKRFDIRVNIIVILVAL